MRETAVPSTLSASETRGRGAGYRAADFLFPELHLDIELHEGGAVVRSQLRFERVGAPGAALRLDGPVSKLREVRLDGARVHSHVLEEGALVFVGAPATGMIETLAEIDVSGDDEGLLRLDDALLTNCEPEGLRRITFVEDRPDVLTRMSCRLMADRSRFPVLLSNGNLIDAGECDRRRHYALWKDPYPKAGYLFALVAGRFERIAERFRTRSGRAVEVGVYAPAELLRYCRHGLETLKQAMAWDERVFGLEYDLDVLNVVVAPGYPGGAMECKGLNLFAPEFFLADPEIMTDDDMHRVEAVIGHEYFHNWTGNRVGLREWRELALKEGLTVLREQDFMADRLGPDEARLSQVKRLTALQYPEDDGALSHSVRPVAFAAANNLYTRTVYEKGAEILRMLRQIVGEEAFLAGVCTFMRRFDGRAATLDMLLDEIESASGRDLGQFRRWYDVPGRPLVEAKSAYDPLLRRCELTLTQSFPRDPDAPQLHIPVSLGLLGGEHRFVELRDQTQTIVFENLTAAPIPVLFRGLTAPVDWELETEAAVLRRVALEEADIYSRWRAVRELVRRAVADEDAAAGEAWIASVGELLLNANAAAGRLLELPSEAELALGREFVAVEKLAARRQALACAAAQTHQSDLREAVLAERSEATPAGRVLHNACLTLLMQAPEDSDVDLCRARFAAAQTMTLKSAALRLLLSHRGAGAMEAAQAYHAWRGTPALDHWFAAHAASAAPDGASSMCALVEHRDFCWANNARLKATFDTFLANQSAFHAADGSGYALITQAVLSLDERQPRLAARFVRPLAQCRRFDTARQSMMQAAMREIAVRARSREVLELVASGVAGGQGA